MIKKIVYAAIIIIVGALILYKAGCRFDVAGSEVLSEKVNSALEYIVSRPEVAKEAKKAKKEAAEQEAKEAAESIAIDTVMAYISGTNDVTYEQAQDAYYTFRDSAKLKAALDEYYLSQTTAEEIEHSCEVINSGFPKEIPDSFWQSLRSYIANASEKDIYENITFFNRLYFTDLDRLKTNFITYDEALEKSGFNDYLSKAIKYYISKEDSGITEFGVIAKKLVSDACEIEVDWSQITPLYWTVKCICDLYSSAGLGDRLEDFVLSIGGTRIITEPGMGGYYDDEEDEHKSDSYNNVNEYGAGSINSGSHGSYYYGDLMFTAWSSSTSDVTIFGATKIRESSGSYWCYKDHVLGADNDAMKIIQEYPTYNVDSIEDMLITIINGTAQIVSYDGEFPESSES